MAELRITYGGVVQFAEEVTEVEINTDIRGNLAVAAKYAAPEVAELGVDLPTGTPLSELVS